MEKKSSLESKLIVVDPGHGGSPEDSFRQGPQGEREEWINLRVALILEQLLLERGARVKLTRREDVTISLGERVSIALDSGADLFFSIHHNSSDPVDPLLDEPMVFTHGHVDKDSLNGALAFCLAEQFARSRAKVCWLDSDQVLFDEGLYLLRNLHGKIPAVLGEYSFFSHPEEERRLSCNDYCRVEALAYLGAVEEFFLIYRGEVYSSSSPLWPPNFRESYTEYRESLLSHGQTSWRDCWLSAKRWVEAGEHKRAKEELLNSLALLRNHPELLDALELLSRYGFSFSEISAVRTCVHPVVGFK